MKRCDLPGAKSVFEVICTMLASPACCLLFISSVLTVTSSQDVTPEIFNQDIPKRYGNNETVTTIQLQVLVDKLGIGNVQAAGNDSTGARMNLLTKCLSSAEISSLRELKVTGRLSATELGTICPTALQQADIQSLCPLSARISHKKPTTAEVWGYGVTAVTLISLASLLGVAFVPLTKKSFFPKILMGCLGLAVGTLFSNAILQLIPEAFGFTPQENSYVFKAVAVFAGFYLLYFTEKMLKILLFPKKQNHSHSGLPEQQLVHEKDDSTLMEVQQNATCNPDNNTTESPTGSNANIVAQEEQPQQACPCLNRTKLSQISTVAWMITLSDGVHNFIDGLAIGVSFTVSVLQGVSTSIAILCEEIPHELGDFVILLNSGMSVPQALCFNFLSACSCYAGLVLGILIGNSFAPNYIFGIAGGMFLYISLADMFPEMNEVCKEMEISGRKSEIILFLIQNAGLLTGFSIILSLSLFSGHIQLH